MAPSAPPLVYSKSADAEFYGASDKKEMNIAPLESGVKKYEEKKYKEAILLFEAVIKFDSINAKALYYNGLSYYDAGLLEKALDNFGKIKTGMDYFEDARWKRALILIKQADKAAARKLLNEISSGNGIYKNNALEELKKLE
jgi:tetratricopeptide (TPR) repeat protein